MSRHRVAVLAALVPCFLWAAPDVPAAPQPAKADAKRPAYTWHEYNRERLDFNQRTLGGAYRQHARHGAWDEAAVRFLDRMAVYFTYGGASAIYRDAKAPTHEELAEAGRAAVDAGCEDPLVAYCLGAVLHDAAKPDDALPHLRKAAAGMAETKYPDLRVWSAARRLAAVEPGTKPGREAKRLAEQRVVRLACGTLTGLERREAHARLREQMDLLGRDDQAKLLERIRKEPDADAWVVNTLDGRLEIDRAWDSRGGGWAAGVPEQGWAGFKEHLDVASQRLTRAWKLAPELPEAPAMMIAVAMAGGTNAEDGEGPRAWFDRAEDAQLDFVDAYDRLLWALQPRWGGSHAEMYDLGLHGARTKRFDTDAPWQLVRAVRAISADSGRLWGELSRAGVYEQLAEVADAYARFHQEKGRGEAAWYRTFRAALAWRAAKYPEARRLLEKLGDAADLSAFGTADANNPWAAAAEVFAATGPNAPAVKRGEAAMAKGDWPAALREFQKLHEPWDPRHAPGVEGEAEAGDAAAAAPDAPKGDEREHAYYDQRIRVLSRRVMLDRGERVVAHPDGTFESWARRAGEWRVADDGTLLGRMVRHETPFMLFEEDTGRRYELSGVAGHTKGGGARAAVLLASAESYTWVVFYERAVLIHYRDGHRSFPRERSPAADFVLRFDDGVLNVTVGGKPVVDAFALPPVTRDQPHLGVAVVDDYRGEAQFRDLAVRKLTDKDPPLKAKEVAKPVAPRAK